MQCRRILTRDGLEQNGSIGAIEAKVVGQSVISPVEESGRYPLKLGDGRCIDTVNMELRGPPRHEARSRPLGYLAHFVFVRSQLIYRVEHRPRRFVPHREGESRGME